MLKLPDFRSMYRDSRSLEEEDCLWKSATYRFVQFIGSIVLFSSTAAFSRWYYSNE